jgi:hypothetical protein
MTTRARRLTVAYALAATLLAAACGSADAESQAGEGRSPGTPPAATAAATATPTPTPTPALELPRGGRSIFPEFRVVAYYGNAESPAMGVLGETGPEQAAARVEKAAKPFRREGRPVLPAFELIVTIADPTPGEDGSYSHPTDPELVRPWVEAARAADMLIVLDIQPGRREFLPEVRRYEEFLRLPHVGLALDSEWRMEPGEVPGRQIGQVSAAEVNEVSAYLAALVAEKKLPEKLLLVHQFRESMVLNSEDIETPKGLAVVHHIDGFGTQGQKLEVYDWLSVGPPRWNGFKLFYDEDIDMMTPAETLALDPAPDFISYQ